MAGAGKYPDRLQLRPQSTTRATSGACPESFDDESTTYLWCRVEPTTGTRSSDLGGAQTGVDCVVYIRNYPTISAKDRLYWPAEEVTLEIEHIRSGDNEQIAQCSYYDELDLGGLDV